jgi:hypothetical protein
VTPQETPDKFEIHVLERLAVKRWRQRRFAIVTACLVTSAVLSFAIAGFQERVTGHQTMYHTVALRVGGRGHSDDGDTSGAPSDGGTSGQTPDSGVNTSEGDQPNGSRPGGTDGSSIDQQAGTTVGTQTPVSVPHLTAQVVNAHSVKLTWHESEFQGTSLALWRDGGSLRDVLPHAQSDVDTEVDQRSQYSYELVATGASEEKEPSNVEYVTTPGGFCDSPPSDPNYRNMDIVKIVGDSFDVLDGDSTACLEFDNIDRFFVYNPTVNPSYYWQKVKYADIHDNLASISADDWYLVSAEYYWPFNDESIFYFCQISVYNSACRDLVPS